MIVNQLFDRTGLSDIETAVLLGLRKHGRRRTFVDILDEAGIYAGDKERFDIALTLEAEGYIHLVTYSPHYHSCRTYSRRRKRRRLPRRRTLVLQKRPSLEGISLNRDAPKRFLSMRNKCSLATQYPE